MLRLAPRIGQLSNRQFRTEIDRLVDAHVASAPVHLRAAVLGRCGCGPEVSARRKFVSQIAVALYVTGHQVTEERLRRADDEERRPP
jgi:hypothetical protein